MLYLSRSRVAGVGGVHVVVAGGRGVGAVGAVLVDLAVADVLAHVVNVCLVLRVVHLHGGVALGHAGGGVKGGVGGHQSLDLVDHQLHHGVVLSVLPVLLVLLLLGGGRGE